MNDKFNIDLTAIELKWLALPKEQRDADIALYEKLNNSDKLEYLRMWNEYERIGGSLREFLAIYTRYIWREEVKEKNRLSPTGNHILDRKDF